MQSNPIVLYLDFDGVLHHENVLWHPKKGAYVQAKRHHHLFAHASLLAHLLSPHPEIKLVLSTSWVHHYSYAESVTRLPPSLQERVIGATFHSAMDKAEFLELPRGRQVMGDVLRRRPRAWLAVDDDVEDWPDEGLNHLIRSDPVDGISAPAVLAELRSALAKIA